MTDQKGAKEWESRKEDFAYWMNRGLDGIITDYVRKRVKGRPWDD